MEVSEKGMGLDKQRQQVFRPALLTSSIPFPPCPGLGTGDRGGAGWLARLWERRRWNEPADDSQTLIARSCTHWGAPQKPPAHGIWAGSQEGLVSSVTSPSTHRHYRVFHLPTLSEASTIRKRLMQGEDARRESRYPHPPPLPTPHPRKPRCEVDPPGRSLT